MKIQTAQLDRFFAMKNPNVVVEDKGILTFNTGIWGSSTDNGMPQFCADLLNYSSTHSNMINLKTSLITGDNLEVEDVDLPNVEELEAFIKRRNKSGMNLKGVWSQAATDMAIFEAACLQVIYDRNGMIAEVYHVPVEDLRLGVPNNYGQIEYGYISKNWAQISNKSYKKVQVSNSAVQVRMFEPSLWKEHPVQVLYLRKYTPSAHYAIPRYLSSTGYILLDNAIANYELNQVNNGYFQNFLLTQQGQPTDAEMKSFIEKYKELNMSAGKPNAAIQTGIFAWVDDIAAQKPSLEAFPTIDTTRFDTKIEIIGTKIIEAHNGYTGLIMDSKGSDLGGDSNRLYQQLAAFQQFVTEPMKDILLGGFDRILQVNQLPAVMVVTSPPKITQPQANVDDLTQDERREIIYGLPPMETATDDTINDTTPIN